jgi:Holliday junction resolvasome RuvABC endonuclease subunit
MEVQEFYMGIDPSTVSTGYAILDIEGNLVEKGVINPPDGSDAKKLAYLHNKLKDIILKYNSSEWDSELEDYTRDNELIGIGIEDQFNGPNVMTLIKIARTASVCMTLAAQTGADLHMFYPSSWRLLFHGNGKATKSDTLQLVNDMYRLNLKGKDNDIADAVGIAHAVRQKCLGGCADIKK